MICINYMEYYHQIILFKSDCIIGNKPEYLLFKYYIAETDSTLLFEAIMILIQIIKKTF